MSDMQLYLIALGIIIIAVVILYNWWQERRLSQDAIRRYDAPVDDPLMGDIRIDPRRDIDFDETTIVIEDRIVMLEDEPDLPGPGPKDIPLEEIPEDTLLSELPGMTQEDLAEKPSMAGEAPSPTVEMAMTSSSTLELGDEEEADSETGDLPPDMDGQIDLIGVISPDATYTGAELREALQPLPGFEKATQWMARNESGGWVALAKDQESTRFNRIACALQLADRSGAVSRECLRKFQHKLETLAEHLNAVLEWRGNSDPLKYAAELDQFCIDVDVMVGFHIMDGGNGPFAATKLRGIAEAGGMTLHEDGAFHFGTESGETLFTLVGHDQRPFTSELLRTAFIHGVSFQMDVPRVRNCPEAFKQMALLARKMESSLGGLLMDDNQQPLNSEAMDKIREQLRIIYAKMVARGIIPGSPSALRLFS